jgi:hypothetical protein
LSPGFNGVLSVPKAHVCLAVMALEKMQEDLSGICFFDHTGPMRMLFLTNVYLVK